MYQFRLVAKKRKGRFNEYLVENLKSKERRVVPSSWVKEAIKRNLVSNAGLSGNTIYLIKDRAIKEISMKVIQDKKSDIENPLLVYKDEKPFSFKEEFIEQFSKYLGEVRLEGYSEFEKIISNNEDAQIEGKYYPATFHSPAEYPDLDLETEINVNMVVDVDIVGIIRWLNQEFTYEISPKMLLQSLELFSEFISTDVYSYPPFSEKAEELSLEAEEGYFEDLNFKVTVRGTKNNLKDIQLEAKLCEYYIDEDGIYEKKFDDFKAAEVDARYGHYY